MNKTKLGDFPVDRLGYGATRVCGPDIWGESNDREAAKRVLGARSRSGVDSLARRSFFDLFVFG
jgi:hypothetical protein